MASFSLSMKSSLVAKPVALRRASAAARPLSVARRAGLKVVAKEFVGNYTATNKYKCLSELSKVHLLREWTSRKANMSTLQGFKNFHIQELAPGVFEVSQTWSSKETYEAWMDSDLKRKSHFAADIYQFPTADKYSVPEEFMPIYHGP